MSEAPEQESKTEEATEKRVRDSVEKGKVPISREVGVLASLLGFLVVSGFFVQSHARRLLGQLAQMLDDPAGFRLRTGADALHLSSAVALEMGRFLLPVCVVFVLCGLAASIFQNAPRIAFDRIKPDLSRISPQKGFARVFGTQGQIEFGKALFKFASISVVVIIIMRAEQATAMNAMFSDPVAIPEMLLKLAVRLVSTISIATIVLVAADLVWARIQWRRELRMTRQEVKDEFKQSEGDPAVKARLRSIARDRTRRRMLAAVPRASFVIANPTHYAVALRYIRGSDAAPVVIAKGADLIALKIRETAEAHDIPVVEDKPLARALYDGVEVDQIIPVDFYRAVAEIIHYLHEAKLKVRL
jgi:flagellar biosynthetic protein FlhB